MSFVIPSGPGNSWCFPLLVHPSGWHQSCICQPVILFSESFFYFVLTCLVLSLGSFTVLSSWYMWAKQFAALFCVRCSFCESMTVCRFPWLSSLSSLVSLQSFVVSIFHTEGCSFFMPCSSGLVKLVSGELCSCFVMVLHFAFVGSCSCAILAWLTASCSSCCWLFHPECIACVCCSRLIFLQFSSANFLKTSQLAFLEFQLGLWYISGGVFWHSIVRKMVVTSSCFFVHFSARYFGYIIGSE